jgi:hypothetical protein
LSPKTFPKIKNVLGNVFLEKEEKHVWEGLFYMVGRPYATFTQKST